MKEDFSHGRVECSGQVDEKEGLRGVGCAASLGEQCGCDCGKVGRLFGKASKLGAMEEVLGVEDSLLPEEGVNSLGNVVAKEN